MITRKMNLQLEQELAHRIIALENELEQKLLTISDFQETLREVQHQPRKHNAIWSQLSKFRCQRGT